MSDQKSTDSGKNFLVFMYKFLFFYCDIPPIMKNHPLVFGADGGKLSLSLFQNGGNDRKCHHNDSGDGRDNREE